MTDKIKSEDFIKAFGSGVKETEHHLIKECKNCKWFGEKSVTGHCIRCRDKDKFTLEFDVSRMGLKEADNDK